MVALMTAIKNKREALSLTRSQLAQRLNCNRSLVFKWEKGDHEPTGTTLIQLLKVLDISLEDL